MRTRRGGAVSGNARTEAHRRYEQNVGLVQAVLARRFPFLLDADVGGEGREADAWSAGALGLLRACERYDPERLDPLTGRRIAFTTYAFPAIEGTVRHWLRDQGGSVLKRPAWMWERAGRVERAQEALRRQLGRDPEPAEVAAAAGLTARAVQALLGAGPHLFAVASLDAPAGADGTGTLGDLVPDGAAGPGQALLDEAGFALLLAPLRDRQRRVVELLYGEGETTARAAARLGVTAQYVSALHRQALLTLRRAHKDCPSNCPCGRVREGLRDDLRLAA